MGIRVASSAAALALLAMMLGACEKKKKGPAESAGETVDAALEEAQKSLEEAADEMGDAADEMKEAVEEGVTERAVRFVANDHRNHALLVDPQLAVPPRRRCTSSRSASR